MSIISHSSSSHDEIHVIFCELNFEILIVFNKLFSCNLNEKPFWFIVFPMVVPLTKRLPYLMVYIYFCNIVMPKRGLWKSK
jgi:hypothetical protein